MISPLSEIQVFDVDLASNLLDDFLGISLELFREVDILDICAKGIGLNGSVVGDGIEISLHTSDTTVSYLRWVEVGVRSDQPEKTSGVLYRT